MNIPAFPGAWYGAVVTRRRRWYLQHPARRRHLRQPVVSIGNLSVGGSGKTPLAALVARLLLDQGEHPAILSRGYGRATPQDGITIVSDGTRMCAGIDTAGDEPLMLARALPAVPVLVGPSRYLSGRLAERRFGATVHVLDDGFQHVELMRDVDLLVIGPQDTHDRMLPAGRLREPLAAAAGADAVLVPVDDEGEAVQVAAAVGAATWFRVEPRPGVPRWLTRDRGPLPHGAPVFAVAAIARPERFFDSLPALGWTVAGTMRFRDHHRFTARDVQRLSAAARAAGAVIVTTEKDAVRLERCTLGDLAVAVLPLVVEVEPARAFAEWLRQRIAAARTQHPAPCTLPPAPGTRHGDVVCESC